MKKLQMEDLNRLSVEDFKETNKHNFCLILDDVRSMNNVGSAFRTADAFLVEKIYLCGITASPPHREIEKTALGSTESVAWEYRENIIELVNQLQAEGYVVLAVEQVENSLKLNDFMPETNQKYAFIFGNEVFGVNQTIVEMANNCLEVPQFGTKHSLNISVTVGIICWDFVSKQLKTK
ncbi:23S rRNA (guanosine-2'-O-)-methyltransferase RlmB [Emticicia aquatica]|jgi:tRNA G18 (ribose-2'-O)-methylase SpoU|uniref:23S rRNA (Guanosine-2'-O-)-methyltransferase RlmB n=1 Tax=Emticicia aquatica TaxID=1681835 RepID=A0ABM9ALE1_9BACT|nr:RNA methyltransferase [Emticicia aquatica]CAH0994285.1 23S rRNA (guanosine-2'-O-)-methyltransferase RlmB [Emticicia aquatica]